MSLAVRTCLYRELLRFRPLNSLFAPFHLLSTQIGHHTHSNHTRVGDGQLEDFDAADDANSHVDFLRQIQTRSFVKAFDRNAKGLGVGRPDDQQLFVIESPRR